MNFAAALTIALVALAWSAPASAVALVEPPFLADRVAAAGNAAGTGARIALLNRAARAEIESVVRRVEKVETAIEPRFQEHFIEAMALPHKTHPFPNLAKEVSLPEPKEAARPDGEGRTRRRRRG